MYVHSHPDIRPNTCPDFVHFLPGSSAPGPLTKGYIRLYNMRFSPFAQRTKLVPNVKGIKHETINIHLKEKPDWFLEKNPLGLVPAIETETDEVVYESPITCDYLNEVYSQNVYMMWPWFDLRLETFDLKHLLDSTPELKKLCLCKRILLSKLFIQHRLCLRLLMLMANQTMTMACKH
ncbi:glutathione S-transferase omega-2-like [Boleophthalmus pectinirostris]|uniref:glutathione S-transferase omega-2-like n=1 Tax=Boleophthalmus pectinirostris TaxID=150288 RepID=UPI002430A7D3|nr:glutathione S-transferase omega-2-like [Boleophthalmus pectinirostris]